MSVSNYTPDKAYKYSKLKNVLYLVSASHVKNIHIDNGEAYIDDLSETPTRIKGYNIQFTEEEALDERYKFEKTVTISVNGYADINTLNDKYYAIIETVEGTLYMVNIDFPSRITHTYTLSNGVSQTDFTFRSQSNYPTLKLSTSITASDFECTGYRHPGKISLKLIDKNNVRISTHSNKITTYSDTWKDVKFIGNSCTLKEEYDGEKVTDTISFDIHLDDYKTSWHYNLLEFLDNLYASIISVDGESDKFYSGYNFGLIPSFSIKGGSNNTDSNIITVTLTEASEHGMVVSSSITGDSSTGTTWIYVKTVGSVKGYECVGTNTAQYTLQMEVDMVGNPTGQYKALVGHQNDFPTLNIVGTFNTVETFYTTECGGEVCSLTTDMPTNILYDSITCNTYSLSSTCQWDISDLPSYITASPVTGDANTGYSVTICNTQQPTLDAVTGAFRINYGGNTRLINVTVQNDEGAVKPTSQYADCLPQTLTFSYNPSCPITIVSIDPELEYNINAGTFTVTVPRNLSTSTQKVWSIVVKDCNNIQQTVNITQDKTYEAWKNTSSYICYSGDSYVQQQRYTGTTSDNITTPVYPTETRRGALIQTDDPRCHQVITRYEFLGNYYCLSGNKVKCLEQQISYDSGETWQKTGLTILGEVVETASTFCQTTATTEWRINSGRSQCGDDAVVMVTLKIKNNTSSQVSIQSRITLVLNGNTSNPCYQVITPVNSPSIMNLASGETITMNDVYIDTTYWTSTRNFCDVENCAAYQAAYPDNPSNVWLYDSNGDSTTIVPQAFNASTPILDGETYTININ